MYDIVVVGAGPAGATAAKYLAEKEIHTLLIDKRTYPREKPCGGVLSMRTLKRFPYITNEFIDAYSFGGCISSSSLQNHIQVQKEKPIAAFVIRKHFDQKLVNIAIERGAMFRDGIAVVDIQRTEDRVKIRLSNGEFLESKLVIGADGIWSTVAKQTGFDQHYPHIGRCLFQEFPLESNQLDQYFTEKRLFQFYLRFQGIDGTGWVFPKKHSVNIGIGEIQPTVPRPRKPHLKELHTIYLQILKEKKLIPPSIQGEAMQGGVLPLQPLEKTYADRIVLCGDAAGLMNPLTGDGIHYAMSSGMFAADVCAKALEAGTTSASFLSKYQTLWNSDFGEEMRLCGRVLKILLKGNRDEKYIRLLSKDLQIFDLLLTMANTQGRIQDYKWRIIRRFVSLYIKDILGL